MASKRSKTLTEAVVRDVAGRDLPMKAGHAVATEGTQIGHKKDTLCPIHVRLPLSDMSVLEAMASAEGTTSSALIRKAVKELIRRQGAGLR